MKKIKSFLRKGSGEILGFCYILPGFVLILILVISIAQIALAQEQLEYVVYSSARSAVVCQSYDDARSAARLIANESLDEDYNNINVDIEIDGGDPDAWVKGVYIRVTVTCEVETLFTPLTSDQSSSIVMMVERNPETT